MLLQVEDEEQHGEAGGESRDEKSLNVEQIRDAVMRLDGSCRSRGSDAGYEEKKKVRAGRGGWIRMCARRRMIWSGLLGMRVRIKDRKGKGKIVIEYATVDDYERVVEMLKGSGQVTSGQ